MRDVLNGVGGSSSLIVRARGISLRDPRQQRRLHREAGDRRIVLDDDRDVHGVGERRVVAHDGVGIELRHARRAHHDRRRAALLGLTAVADAGARAVGRRAGNHADAALHLIDDDLEHARRSGSSSRATSPVTPSAVTPLTPAPMNRSTTRRRLASSTSPLSRNGVGRTEYTPSSFTQPPCPVSPSPHTRQVTRILRDAEPEFRATSSASSARPPLSPACVDGRENLLRASSPRPVNPGRRSHDPTCSTSDRGSS